MSDPRKIAVAMSGGVDSSVAAYLLKKEGYDVTGVNLNLWSCFKGSESRTCCSPEDRNDAARVSEALKIPFVSIDMREKFKGLIIEPFVREYSNGRTPNPCIRCNTLIKFGELLCWIERELGISSLATGHYARIFSDAKGFHLQKGADPAKDQTYFLYDIPPDVLARLAFPLGPHRKAEVRKIALEAGLQIAEKAESQEVCFIPDGDVPSFIEDFYPEYAKGPGDFVDASGKKLGHHRGCHAYTIGQRRGLGRGFGSRRYVTEIRVAAREVVLGENRDLMKSEMTVEGLRLIEDVPDKFRAEAKIRYRSEPVPAEIILEDKNRAAVNFERPVRAVTPGQAAVFYNGDLVIGGGWIA